MASSSQPRIKTFKADGAIVANTFVKGGTDDTHVAACGLNERAIGIAVGAASTAEDLIEVYLPGGGARLKVSEAVSVGKMLTSTASGLGEVADAANEWVGAVAYQSGVANDVIDVEVCLMQAAASDA